MGLYMTKCPTCGIDHQWFSGNPDQRCISCSNQNIQPVPAPPVPSKAKYIAFDNETGGTGEDVSLLTVYFAILDEDLNILDELDLTLKPNDGLYKIEPESLTVNNINLVEHDKVAISYSQGGQQLVKFLKKHSKGGKDGLIPLGHNVAFDIDGVCNNLLGRKTWNQYVSYRIQDTQVIGRFMQVSRWLDPNESMSLFNQAKMYGISIPGVEHTSKYDTLLTIEVYKYQVEMMKRMKSLAGPLAGGFDDEQN